MTKMKPFALQKASADNGFDDLSLGFSADRDEGPDYCSRDGALELKRKIEAYWAERGQHVTVLLHNGGFHPAIRAARFDLRSDLINGMPRWGRAAAPAKEPQDVFVEDFGIESDDIEFE